jgi:hypothetical protein
MPWGNLFQLVDLAANDIEIVDQADPSLPQWDGKDFVNPVTQLP